jgi:uncharacterized protein (TIGR00730 family)
MTKTLPVNQKKRICVFCGSSHGVRPSYRNAAQRLGKAITSHGMGLVYGGGGVGLMGVIADAVLEEQGEVIGVLPRALFNKELAHYGLTELRIVSSMHERKALMAELSDSFIAMPGGFGTFEEFFEVVTWAQLGLHTKPIGILNVDGYFDLFFKFLEHMVQEGFIKPKHQQLMVTSQDPNELLSLLICYRGTEHIPKVINWKET